MRIPSSIPARDSPPAHGPGRRSSRWPRAGFALMPVAVALFLLALAAALAGPWFRQKLTARKASAIVADLRAFTAAFQAYAHEHGDWPPGDAAPGAIPRGMEPRLAGTGWILPSPIGGNFRWARRTVQQGARYEAAIVITDFGAQKVTRDRNQLEDIDRRIDDGDLTTGRFQLGFRNQPVFVIEN